MCACDGNRVPRGSTGATTVRLFIVVFRQMDSKSLVVKRANEFQFQNRVIGCQNTDQFQQSKLNGKVRGIVYVLLRAPRVSLGYLLNSLK